MPVGIVSVGVSTLRLAVGEFYHHDASFSGGDQIETEATRSGSGLWFVSQFPALRES
jgi:hypothetical protein